MLHYRRQLSALPAQIRQHFAVADALSLHSRSAMRLRLITPFLLLTSLTACSDGRHPDRMLGTWVNDTVFGGILHAVDTLRLRGDGLVLRSGSTSATEAAETPIKPTVWAEGQKWNYRPRTEGPLLCYFVDKGWEPDCHTVHIASESLLVVDGRGYHRVAGR